ncbi:MAG: MATE family efflux transporter [Candidatus Marinimicrobia bacterium]|nr:MATE family efflux transporter [Candidatus Neomarinimicrobiota bacterium]
MKKKLQILWQEAGGLKDLLTVAVPMVISTIAWTIQHFVDRMFLTWYSAESIAAAMPAGILHFNLVCIFLGIAGYVNVFIAQYHGAGEYGKFGAIIWQGIYISAMSAVFMFLVYPFSEDIFRTIGHAQEIIPHEVIYFKILSLATFPMAFSSAASGFFSGQGKTIIIMVINLAATGVNVVLDYLMIFGKFGFPEMGIKGAAIATSAAFLFSALVYAYCLFKKENNRQFNTVSDFKFNASLFRQLLKFGLPNGLQMFIEVAGFSFFVMVVGRLGKIELVASNIALNINNLIFMPLLGISMSVSILTGQFLGENNPHLAEKVTRRGYQLAYVYIFPYLVVFLFFPDLIIRFFNIDTTAGDFAQVYRFLIVIMRFTAIYSWFDVLNLVLAGCLKGAGDTNYVMKIISVASVFVMIIPNWIFIAILRLHLFWGWSFISAYVAILGISFYLRFRSGKWKEKRVIYRENRFLPEYPDIPAAEI